ncbi:outer membrane beta-barrel protein [Cyclobacterium sp. 1_MG-2023]|uniref:outer membrane beta-barrel protein n=1 Tax=Cyclobacterium sp. 1_MG-2023 TaxID=3062681 RepID=UPI0026E31C23|nr:outer membrane beta-barrel protein [Cyclobacterium sp. 1_MG-2023]MDO6437000.1 outer membrane beta-barrel protein [Cyclobacterium sp. 1_MG-2023]
MKKFLILFVYLGIYSMGQEANAQISQGNHSVGLEFGWSDRSVDFLDERIQEDNYFRFTPSYSYFIKDQLSIIGGGRFYTRKINNTYQNANSPGWKRKELDVFVGLRKHIEISPKLFMIATYGLRYSWTDNLAESVIADEEDFNTSRQKVNQFGLFGNLGLAYFPSEKFSFELIFIEGQFFKVYNKHIWSGQYNSNYQDNGWGFEVDGFLDQPSLAVRYYF